MNHKVSVILLSYNQSAFILDCLRGFEKQTFRDFEIILIDDGSSDDSLEKINEWTIKTEIDNHVLVNSKNLGICRSINRALTYTEGAFVCVMACDDWPDPNYLEVMYGSISRANVQVAFAFAHTRQVDEKGILLERLETTCSPTSYQYEPPELFDELLRVNKVQAPAVIIRRSAIEESGNYDETLYFEDYDMWLKLSSKYAAIEIKRPLVNYRIVAKSMSRNSLSFVARKTSEIRVLLKWKDTKRPNKVVIAHRIRNLAAELIIQGQGKVAAKYLDSAGSLVFDYRWSIIRLLLRIKPAEFFIKKWLASR